jgi:hypothetical protein
MSDCYFFSYSEFIYALYESDMTKKINYGVVTMYNQESKTQYLINDKILKERRNNWSKHFQSVRIQIYN